jgi:hypothetical protein
MGTYKLFINDRLLWWGQINRLNVMAEAGPSCLNSQEELTQFQGLS